VFVAILIFMNFGIGCFQRQVDPHHSTGGGNFAELWNGLDIVFTAFFTLELLFNMYGSWFWVFWVSGWNLFDTLVVAISILVLCWEDMPSELQIIKLMRAFRVFRLFNRVQSMKKILASIGKAVPGMVSAFGIMILMLCIYSVLAVDLFKGLYEKDCQAYCDADLRNCVQEIVVPGQTQDVLQTISNCPADIATQSAEPGAITPRGMCYGLDYYGQFSRAAYTLFQVLTGDSWSEACVRPILAFYEEADDSLYIALTVFFFVSFIVVNALVLLNVVVALLMDGMAGGEDEEQQEDEGGADGEISESIHHASGSKEAMEKAMENEMKNLQASLAEQSKQLKEQQDQFSMVVQLLKDIRADPALQVLDQEVITEVPAGPDGSQTSIQKL
jgi:hypothetical protein